MAQRIALRPGSIVKMPNQGQYVIDEKIGEGGLSLIYSAKTKTNDYPVIIKEFFPAEHAHRAEKTLRDSRGVIVEKKNRVYPDDEYAERFERCLRAFEREGQLGSSARLHHFQIISFTDCGDGYAVLPCWSNNSRSFGDVVESWGSAPPKSNDLAFPDLGRIHFALTAVSSLLTVLSSVHEQGMLHLDISPSNVVWSGESNLCPENGVAFLTDFGCSVYMEEKSYPAECVLSYSKMFAAPEYAQKDGRLTEATDVYAVGRLLAFLCVGHRMFFKPFTVNNLIGKLHIPNRDRKLLLEIIQKATAEDMHLRYPSAIAMKDAVGELLTAIPKHPINPDNTTAFSLYSLKSMLEGSLSTHYSWAHELCDRRNIVISLPEQVYRPVADSHFADDESFLRAVLPNWLYRYLSEQVSKEVDKRFYLTAIMSGNYSNELRAKIRRLLRQYDTRELLIKSRTLLADETTFQVDQKLLFQILGEDGNRLRNCYYNCNAFKVPYIGLGLLVVFALLGVGGFEEWIPSPSRARELFSAL